jgi:Holliday junction DNA helicase RuvB
MNEKTVKNQDKNSPKLQDEGFLDSTLRPDTWAEYVGQEHIKDNVKILLLAASERNHPAEHILFYGPPGLGKTTLAHLIARETGRQIRVTSGPAIEKVGDLASILTNLQPGDILFIDEIHRLNKMIEEILYPAMESGVLDIIIGKGPSARTIQLDLPPFTLIGATTKVASLSAPLRSRFSGGAYRLEYYSIDELTKIVERSAKLLGLAADNEAINEVVIRSRQTPRTANYFLKRVRDFAQVYKKDATKAVAKEALDMLGVDDNGLNQSDRKYLEVLIEKFGGGPTGVNTLASALSEEEATIEDVIEPYLIQQGLIERTSRGRIATNKAYELLGFDVKEK